MGERRVNLVQILIVAFLRQTVPEGCVVTDPISRMAEARVVKFCTQGDYIKSCQMNDIRNSGSRGPLLHVDLWTKRNSPWHAESPTVPKQGQQFRRRRTSVARTYNGVDASDARLYTKAEAPVVRFFCGFVANIRPVFHDLPEPTR